MLTNITSILALDVGTVRIGLAIARAGAWLPSPLVTLSNNENFTEQLQSYIDNESVGQLVIGLPRGLDGQDTAQTALVRQFADQLAGKIGLPIEFQDEALSSTRAKEELVNRGSAYEKGDVDALAATFILEDYLQDNKV